MGIAGGTIRTIGTTVLLALFVLSACDSMQLAEEAAHERCAKEGKEPMILDRQRIHNSAALTIICIDKKQVVHTTDTFGVDTLTDLDTLGATVISVAPMSIADRAGVKVRDVIYEYAGKRIGTAKDLRSAVLGTSAGDRISIRLHRDQKEIATTALF